jgi:GntR family transcriptional regulator/MocR family aminotransferase
VDLHLEPGGTGGRRASLEHALRDAVRSGRLRPGERLPSSRTLAVELGLSRGTVCAAYDQLVAEGHLVPRRGAGTVVATVQRASGVPVPSERPSEPALDLRPGTPDVTTFPVTTWVRATRRALSSAPSAAFGYGDPRGRVELRTALAGYLARTRGVLVSPEQIVVTTGCQQGLSIIAEVVHEAGTRTVATEDPGLPFHRDLLVRQGHELVPLPVDDHGARTDLLTTHPWAEVGAVLVTPAHQYPTGSTMHPTRRHALASWARDRAGWVLEDDYDGEFRYDRQPVGALQGMAPDRVVYLGSASKTLGPAVRLGWMVVPPALVDAVVETKKLVDHQTGAPGQLALADLIERHDYDRHVRSCRLHYRRRRDALEQALASVNPGEGPLTRGISAGLQTLVGLPKGGPTEREVLRRADSRGLALTGLAGHWHGPVRRPGGVVVGFATPAPHSFRAALDALVDVLR